MTDQGARCPQCQISFRVTLPQLRAAGGLVRCGFCLAPFDAHAHQVSLTAEAARDDVRWRHLTNPGGIDGAPPGPGLSGHAPQIAGPQAQPELERAETPLPPWPTVPAAPRRRHSATAVAAAGGALVFLQALYFHADLLAGHPAAQPVYRVLCGLVPCRYQSYKASAGVEVERVAVRPLPPTGLRLDAMLTNHSTGPRALPGIRVEFEDLQGVAVAGRTFMPDQYLGDAVTPELAGGQSLHLALELQDPGPAAVSYRVDVVK